MGIGIYIKSKQSKIVALDSIRRNRAKLNSHRMELLKKVPNSSDYAYFPKNHIKEEDLAFLTAYTYCEFAWLIGKTDDILFHGEKYCCSFNEELSLLLKSKKYELYSHSHPDEDNPEPSIADRNTLTIIKQEQSRIISATTLRVTNYSNNKCLDYLL